MEFSRREMLKGTLAAGAAAGLAGCDWLRWRPEGQETARAAGPAKPETWIPTACAVCPEGCGLRVRVVEGNARKVEGDPVCPRNLGGVCPKGQAAVQVLYDPDRVRGPLRRVGERGEGRFEPVSWGTGLALAVEALLGIRQRGRSQAVLALQGEASGLRPLFLQRFMEVFGGGPVAIDSPGHLRPDLAAYAMTQGVTGLPTPDFERARFVLSFGAALLEGGSHSMSFQRAYGDFRRGDEGRRGRFVQVEPRLSGTATKADRWIPARSGTEGALALGLAHVILEEGLEDRAFLKEHTQGFDAFSKFVRDGYPPDHVTRVTGVPPRDIVELARAFARTRPAIALPSLGAGVHTNSALAGTAIHALNALVGSIGVPGGLLAPSEMLPPAFGPVPRDPTEAGQARPGLLQDGESIEDALGPGPEFVEALVLLHADPLSWAADRAGFEAALARVPWIVSFSSTLDDTTRFADLVLPDHTALERLDLLAARGSAATGLQLVRPAVGPVHDTRDAGATLMALAHGLGGTVAQAFPWKDWGHAVQDGVRRLLAGGHLRSAGFAETWAQLLQDGGVFERHPWREDWDRALPGPAHRFVFVPRDEPPLFSGAEQEWPLHLLPFRPLMHADGVAANSPWLLESYGLAQNEGWEPWVEVNPRTAEGLGIEPGERVRVESARGGFLARAHLTEGIALDVVAVPLGLGHRGYGRWASGRGTNPVELFASLKDATSGAPAFSSTRVRLVRS